MEISDYLRKSLASKRLIFTIGAGRNGSAHLARLMGFVPGVASFHEPAPYFWEAKEAALADRNQACEFWREKKLRVIAECKSLVYFESSHLACKGFLEVLDGSGVPFDLVYLRRDPRKIAQSLHRLGTVPERTESGVRYLWAPRQLVAFQDLQYDHWNDYQLTFWYAKSIQMLADAWRVRFAEVGRRFISVTVEEISSFGGYWRLLKALKLYRDYPRTWYWFWRTRGQKTNVRTYAAPDDFSKGDLDSFEAEVTAAIQDRKISLDSRRVD